MDFGIQPRLRRVTPGADPAQGTVRAAVVG